MRGKAGSNDGKGVSEGDVDVSEEEKGWMREMGISEGKRGSGGGKGEWGKGSEREKGK